MIKQTSARPKRRSDSRSPEHKAAEGIIREMLSEELGVHLRKKARINVGPLREVEVDAISKEPRILIEIYSHIGELKSAQKHKIANDILKLALVKKTNIHWHDARLLMVFACKSAKRSVMNSWHSAAGEAFGIEFLVIDIGQENKATLRIAQKRQDRTRT